MGWGEEWTLDTESLRDSALCSEGLLAFFSEGQMWPQD